jgi:serine/threonine protein kinase
MKANDLENAAPPLDAKRTLVGGHRAAGPSGHVPSLTATVVGTATPQPAARVELEDFDFGERAQDSSPAVAGRTTVLPRTGRGPGEVAVELMPRFHPLKTIGEGAMGEVQLVRDNDIRRTVAVKRLLGGTQSESALLRFADEIRVVGQLEHPGIVPVYDVGRAEDGQLYLVMKHLQGETMENIISRLQAGEPAYVERFTAEYRVRLFLGILDAMVYAHARGVLHRDIKPANIMIGPYGEVTMMDWGIAKPIASKRASSDDVDSLAHTALDSQDERLLETQQGSLAGTPLRRFTCLPSRLLAKTTSSTSAATSMPCAWCSTSGWFCSTRCATRRA